MNFLSWLEQLPFSMWVLQTNAYAYILTAHTIGMMIVAGIVGVIDLRVLGIGSGVPIKPLERLIPLAWAGFWINAVTGTTLMIADATTKLTNYDFYIKMVFVFSGVVLLKMMPRGIFATPELDQKPVPGSAKKLAWASLICWVAAITAGRLLAYLGPVSGIPGLSNK
jgi:hypothetical protein